MRNYRPRDNHTRSKHGRFAEEAAFAPQPQQRGFRRLKGEYISELQKRCTFHEDVLFSKSFGCRWREIAIYPIRQ